MLDPVYLSLGAVGLGVVLALLAATLLVSRRRRSPASRSVAPAASPPAPAPPAAAPSRPSMPVPTREIDLDRLSPRSAGILMRSRLWPPDGRSLPLSQWPPDELAKYHRDRCSHCLRYWQRHAEETRQQEAAFNELLRSEGKPPEPPRDLSCREECAALSQPQPAAQHASQQQAPQQGQQPEEARRPQPYVGYYGNNGWPWEQNKKR